MRTCPACGYRDHSHSIAMDVMPGHDQGAGMFRLGAAVQREFEERVRRIVREEVRQAAATVTRTRGG